jgi:hypothetical protein
MPLWHQLMNRKPLFSISKNYSQHCQTTLSWSKYYSLVSIGVNRSVSEKTAELTLIHINIRSVHYSYISQSEGKQIMTSPIKSITSVLKVSTFGLAAILTIMSVSTFKTDVILYLFSLAFLHLVYPE